MNCSQNYTRYLVFFFISFIILALLSPSLPRTAKHYERKQVRHTAAVVGIDCHQRDFQAISGQLSARSTPGFELALERTRKYSTRQTLGNAYFISSPSFILLSELIRSAYIGFLIWRKGRKHQFLKNEFLILQRRAKPQFLNNQPLIVLQKGAVRHNFI